MNRPSKQLSEVAILQSRAKKLRVGIVVARFNADITEKLLDGAKKTLLQNGVLEKNIKTFFVPGGFEIPLVCQRLATAPQQYDALIAIGCVIRGDTDHYVYIANESSRGVMEVMLKTDTLIANCILTVNTLEQAQDRCQKIGNKGSEAALAVLQMISVEEKSR